MRTILEVLHLTAVMIQKLQKILEAEKFPETFSVILQHSTLIHSPLAVRSSSLLEDSQYHPFAGVYETYCFPTINNSFDKIKCLLNTIKSDTHQHFIRQQKITSRSLPIVLKKKRWRNNSEDGWCKQENRYYPQFFRCGKII